MATTQGHTHTIKTIQFIITFSSDRYQFRTRIGQIHLKSLHHSPCFHHPSTRSRSNYYPEVSVSPSTGEQNTFIPSGKMEKRMVSIVNTCMGRFLANPSKFKLNFLFLRSFYVDTNVRLNHIILTYKNSSLLGVHSTSVLLSLVAVLSSTTSKIQPSMVTHST